MRPIGRFRSSVAIASIVLVVSACSNSSSSPAASAAAPSAAAPSAAAPSAEASASAAASQAAGASAEPTPITGASCAANATEVKFWTSHTPPDSDALKHIVEAFNTANPDICVKMTTVPGAETDLDPRRRRS
jgi:ABC-type glycerol-3-phosphate transport system substrate-binding protein